jgi:hypothetical protein
VNETGAPEYSVLLFFVLYSKQALMWGTTFEKKITRT